MRTFLFLALTLTLSACKAFGLGGDHGSAADAVSDAVANGEMELPTSDNQIVPANDGLIAVHWSGTPDNANPAQALGWRGYGFGGEEDWASTRTSMMPVTDETGQLLAFAAYLDVDQEYRMNCAESTAEIGGDGWCEFNRGSWTLSHDDGNGPCEDGVDVVVGWDMYGEPYRPDGSDLGSLDCG